MDFRMRIGLGKHVAERKNEVVQVPMIVELALIVIKIGIRALRNSVQNPAHPLTDVRGCSWLLMNWGPSRITTNICCVCGSVLGL